MLELSDYSYLSLPPRTGDLAVDVRLLLERNAKESTWQHSAAVAEKAAVLADRHALSAVLCRQAGLLHDISAVMKVEDMLEHMRSCGAWLDSAELAYPFLLHQRISAEIAAQYFGISDERVLSAVACHTTLKPCSSDYDKALFIADKLAWDRQGIPPYYDRIYQLALSSLAEACREYIEYVFAEGQLLYPHSWLIKARSDLFCQEK